jgi:hypothetical protein
LVTQQEQMTLPVSDQPLQFVHAELSE